MNISVLLAIATFILINVGIERFNKSSEVRLTELSIRGIWFLCGYYATPVISYLLHG